MDLLADQPCCISISPDTTGEREFLPSLSEFADCLMLIDRGYFDLNWFDEVNSHQGCYIARCRNNVNPVVDEAWQADGKALKHVKGKCLKNVAGKLLKRQRVEFMVHWGGDKEHKIKARLIAFWNADEKCYTWLITNLPREEFTLDEVSETYRLHWQIELVFMCKE
jgi:IS4 transposase